MKRRRKPTFKQPKAITPDAFLEIVLDCEGDEEIVLGVLEVRDRALHGWMAANPATVQAARDGLRERGVDLSEPMLGWLRGDERLASTADEDGDWARYRDLILEEQVLDAKAVLEGAKARTADLVARLQAEKRARRPARPAAADEPDQY